jgi:hypothetical protein
MTLDIDGIRISQPDVNELSRQWQVVVMNVEYASSAVAMRVLSALWSCPISGDAVAGWAALKAYRGT